MATIASTHDAINYLTGKYGMSEQQAVEVIQRNGGINAPVLDSQLDQWAQGKHAGSTMGALGDLAGAVGGAVSNAVPTNLKQAAVTAASPLGALGPAVANLLPSFGGGGGNQPVSTAPGTQPTQLGPSTSAGPSTTSPAGQGYSPLVSPLAMSLFYQQNVAPLLEKISTRNTDEMGQMISGAKNFLNQVQLPPGIKDILMAGENRTATDYADLNKTLETAAVTQPALDNLMNQLAATQKQQAQTYLNAGNTSSTAAILQGLGLTPPATPTK